MNLKFFFNGKFSILNGRCIIEATWQTNLYYLDTEGLLATWKLVPNFRPSFSQLMLDFSNSFVVSRKPNEIIIISIVNNRIYFHIISTSIQGIERSSATFTLPKLHGSTAKFIMQSCIVLSNCIYCGLLQQGISACIYQVKVLENYKSMNVRLVNTWHINDDFNLQNCFILVHNGEVYISCRKDAANKTTIELKRLKLSCTVESIAHFTFPYLVKVSAVSVVSRKSLVIAVIYQNNETNEFYIKRINMAPSHPSTADSGK